MFRTLSSLRNAASIAAFLPLALLTAACGDDPVTGATVHATSVAVSRGRRGEPPVEIAEVMPGSLGGGVWPARPALLHLRLPSGGWLWIRCGTP